jgi:hypothetical protein
VESPEAEVEGLSLVFVGEFAPQLIQPSWLARLGLLSETEADAADVQVISSEVTQFDVDWLEIQVTRQKLQLQTTLSHSFIALHDIGSGILKSLPFARVVGMGINHDAHFRLKSEEIWHSIGHRLAPKKLWERVTKSPGLNSLLIEGQRSDDRPGKYNFRVEPSRLVKPHALFASVNDHYDIPSATPEESHMDCERLLIEVFRTSLTESRDFFTKLIAFTNETGEALDAEE